MIPTIIYSIVTGVLYVVQGDRKSFGSRLIICGIGYLVVLVAFRPLQNPCEFDLHFLMLYLGAEPYSGDSLLSVLLCIAGFAGVLGVGIVDWLVRCYFSK